MIGTSTLEYVFIRTCVVGLRAITPISIIYCIGLPFLYQRPPLYLSAWPIAEVAFYFLAYLPRRWMLQRPAVHPQQLPPAERKEIFSRSVDQIPDPERYLTKWFKDAPISEIKRDNVKEFYRWAFFNTGVYDPIDDLELDEYVTKFETTHNWKLEPGYGNATCLRLTLDPVDMVHRSLLWYSIVFLVDNFTHISMLFKGFHFYRTSVTRLLTTFPPRPLTLISARKSPVETLSYWHSPHTSTSKLPIVFIHGIGIGLLPYVDFLATLKAQDNVDGAVGIIAIEILPISFRITHSVLGREEMCRQIQTILLRHGFEKFVLVTHSYGTVIANHLLKDPLISEQIDSLVLVDPVSILLHLPDVAYNFTYRYPTRANEWQLWYFACKDMGVAHTLFRTFFWSENVLWKDEFAHKRVTVFLGGRDLIVNTPQVARYLTSAPEDWDGESGLKADEYEWTGPDGRLKVVWCDELDHAQIFDSKRWSEVLVEEVLSLSRIVGEEA